jgi:hypothetical protein
VFSIALATSVLHALGSPDHSTPASAPVPIPAVPSAPSPTPTGPAAVYGDPSPAALKPAVQAEGRPRTVCVDETRPLPARGAWTCHSTVALDGGEIGRRPTDPGGPCTHRAVSEAGGSWNCWTRIAIPKLALGMPYAVPLMFGHIQAADAGSAGPDMSPRVCREQSRTSETQGPWRCVSWQDAPDGWRIAEPLDPGGPCSYRIADEETGVWSCQSATAQDTQAP